MASLRDAKEKTMPRTSQHQASQVVAAEGFEGRYEELGGYTVGFETHAGDADYAPLFKGLPDDRCQCPHWGTVVKGKIAYRYPDHEETYEAGDSYYAPPGHLPMVVGGVELIEFSPTDKLQETMQVVGKNIEAMTTASS